MDYKACFLCRWSVLKGIQCENDPGHHSLNFWKPRRSQNFLPQNRHPTSMRFCGILKELGELSHLWNWRKQKKTLEFYFIDLERTIFAIALTRVKNCLGRRHHRPVQLEKIISSMQWLNYARIPRWTGHNSSKIELIGFSVVSGD